MNEIRIPEAQKEYLRSEKICTRAAKIPSVIDDKLRTARTVAATETPSEIIDWERWEVVREILLITEQSVILPESKQLPLLDSHSRARVENVKGSIRELRVENNELVGVSYFAENAEQEFSLVRDGHLTDVSVGYRTFPEHTVIIPKGEKAVIDGREFVNDYEDGLTMLVRTKWQPKEVSLVAIGADERAKFREDNNPEIASAIGRMSEEIKEIRTEMENKLKIITKGEPNMDEKKKLTDEEIRQAERERISAIESFAERFAGKVANLKEKAREAVKNGTSVEEFRGYILDNLDTSQPIETPASQIGMSEKEAREFSISRAILAAGKRDWSGAKYERDVIVAVAEKTGKEFSPGKVILPREVQLLGARSLLTSGTGGNVVGTELRGDEFIEFLRNKVVLGKAGMRTLTGLSANISIPKQTAGATITAISEGGAVTASDPSLTQVAGSPNTVSGQTKFSRKLLIQSNPSIDQIVYDDLYNQLAVKIDYYGLHGSGTAPEPTGIANVTGVGAVDASAGIDWSKVVEFESLIESANANSDTMKWIMNASLKGKLKTTLKATNTGIFLMSDNGEVNGFGSLVTQNAQSGYLFFGDFSQLIFAEWGAVELIVDPYTDAASAMIGVTIVDEIDFLVRQAGAFAVSDNVPV